MESCKEEAEMSEIKRENICGVVVTFNRKELLIECLKALTEQTKSLDSILIIDNASTDGTPQLLFDLEYIQHLPPVKITAPYEKAFLSNIKNVEGDNIEIIYIRMDENTGGAGGFYMGQKRAYELGYEWIWLMDDDGYPERDCLSILLDTSQSKKLKATNPLVIDMSNKEKLSFGLSKKIMNFQSAIEASVDGLIMNKANPFNGTLLHCDLIKDVGFIKKEMFIWGDEVEYFKRLACLGFEFATVVDSLFYHPATKTVYSEKLFGLLRVAKKPANLEMNFYRNQGYINMKYGRYSSHIVIVKNFIFFLLGGDFKKAFLFLFYYMDGLLDNYRLKNLRF